VTDTSSEITRRIIENRNLILGYILAHTRDHNNAEDIFQDICMTICQKYSEFEPGTNFKAWAMQITRYKILSHYQRQTKHDRMLHLTPELAETLADPTLESDLEPALENERKALRTCLKKVKGRNRILVLKRYGEGLSCQEVAQAVHWTVNAVYVALSRIRDALERCIGSELRAMDGSHE
jgi:RNA polymerase sigma-70 factor (ECF subfamily)